MLTVIMESWNEGLQKISLTKLQVEVLGISLRDAKNNVDNLLDNKKVILKFNSVQAANDFVKNAEIIGVNCRFLIEPPTSISL